MGYGARNFFPINDRGMGRFQLFGLGVKVGGGVHDRYTFQCGLVSYFTSPGIDTR